ncbi:LytR/AlgR family response regulator transcription factor [Brevibacillus agri]|nr:response regulator [Brevibacillus agri]
MALDKIVQAPPQAVFLDIQMPERNGIELAERILQEHPDTAIIFVTAYDEYAIKAFELNALDYLLKPIQYDRLQKTIERLFKSRPPQPASVLQAGTGFLRCFRSLQMEQAGREPVTIRWKTVKGQEVFAFLLHHRGNGRQKAGAARPALAGHRLEERHYAALYDRVPNQKNIE